MSIVGVGILSGEQSYAVVREVHMRSTRILRDPGLWALVITHDLRLARNIADRVLMMHHGRIVENGTVEQVLLDSQDTYTKTVLSVAPAMLGQR
jgi:peptide/nickel transport system ATP-binding protein